MPTRTSAAESVFTTVREEILAGLIPGGEALSELEVAARLGVSRTPVHEAFLRLAAEDLIRQHGRRGAIVTTVGPAEARDLLEVRLALEVAAARRLAGTDGAAGRVSLAERLDAMHAEQLGLARSGDVAAFAVADAAFHRAVVEASGNAMALRMLESTIDRQRRMTHGAVGSRPERLERLAEEHRNLGSLVVEGRSADYEAALADHLSATHEVMVGVTLAGPLA